MPEFDLAALPAIQAHLLLVLWLAAQPLTLSELARQARHSRNSLYRHLPALLRLELLELCLDGHHWQLSPAARDLFGAYPTQSHTYPTQSHSPSHMPPPAPSSVSMRTMDEELKQRAPLPQRAALPQRTPSARANTGHGRAPGVHDLSPQRAPARAAGIQSDIKEIDSLNQISLETLLSAAGGLFGERLHLPYPQVTDCAELLGWIAYAWERRERFDHPVRVIFANLRRGWSPPIACQRHPERFLPGAFLRELGLVPPAADASLEEPDADTEDPTDTPPETAAPPVPDASLELPAGPASMFSAAEAFEAARDGLAVTLNPVLFQRYLSGVQPLRFDPEAGQLVLLAARPADLVWLERFARDGLQRLLKRQAGRELQVVFT